MILSENNEAGRVGLTPHTRPLALDFQRPGRYLPRSNAPYSAAKSKCSSSKWVKRSTFCV